jgi:uncharacterized protein (UPF0297 family)
MGLPGIDINVKADGLGASVSVDDGIMGLILSGPAPSELTISTPAAIFSLQEAEVLGIDADYDTDNTVDSYQQIKDFYTFAPKGTELWIMVIPPTTTMESACDKDNDVVKKLLNAAAGRVKMWGIHRIPDGAYEPTYDDGLDDDVSAAVLVADALCDSFADQFRPCRALIGGLGFQGVVGDLKDFSLSTNDRVGVVIGSVSEDGHPAVGFTLGKFASIPVQRKISRVKDGDIGKVSAYMTDGETIETYEASMDALHDKGYIFFRTITEKSGYFFSSDPACVSAANDFASLARGRVIDKAIRLTYLTMVEELEDDIDIDASGYIASAVLKDYQNKIKNALETQMADNLSTGNPVVVEIDPAQNVLATGKVKIDKLAIRPKGYASLIEIDLGFDNPINS